MQFAQIPFITAGRLGNLNRAHKRSLNRARTTIPIIVLTLGDLNDLVTTPAFLDPRLTIIVPSPVFAVNVGKAKRQ